MHFKDTITKASPTKPHSQQNQKQKHNQNQNQKTFAVAHPHCTINVEIWNLPTEGETGEAAVFAFAIRLHLADSLLFLMRRIIIKMPQRRMHIYFRTERETVC